MTGAGLDLPLIECPVAGSPRHDTFVIFMSGDGGWARFDRSIAAELVAAGVPVVGWSAFRYLWRRRTPAGIAADLARIMTHYTARWQAQHVVLAGFSRGADLLPFAFNRLSSEQADQVCALTLLAVTAEAGFGYRVIDWLGIGRLFGPPPGCAHVAPEIARLPADRTLIINGADDAMALPAAALAGTGITLDIWPGGHHIGHAHAAIAARILARI